MEQATLALWAAAFKLAHYHAPCTVMRRPIHSDKVLVSRSAFANLSVSDRFAVLVAFTTPSVADRSTFGKRPLLLLRPSAGVLSHQRFCPDQSVRLSIGQRHRVSCVSFHPPGRMEFHPVSRVDCAACFQKRTIDGDEARNRLCEMRRPNPERVSRSA
jgi:hypothetical protein